MMALVHQPADDLVQGALVGHVELLGVVGRVPRLGVAAHAGAAAAGDLRDAQLQRALRARSELSRVEMIMPV